MSYFALAIVAFVMFLFPPDAHSALMKKTVLLDGGLETALRRKLDDVARAQAAQGKQRRPREVGSSRAGGASHSDLFHLVEVALATRRDRSERNLTNLRRIHRDVNRENLNTEIPPSQREGFWKFINDTLSPP